MNGADSYWMLLAYEEGPINGELAEWLREAARQAINEGLSLERALGLSDSPRKVFLRKERDRLLVEGAAEDKAFFTKYRRWYSGQRRPHPEHGRAFDVLAAIEGEGIKVSGLRGRTRRQILADAA